MCRKQIYVFFIFFFNIFFSIINIKIFFNKHFVNGQPSANYWVDRGEMLSVNRGSYVSGHVMVLRIFGAPKSYAFAETSKRFSIN